LTTDQRVRFVLAAEPGATLLHALPGTITGPAVCGFNPSPGAWSLNGFTTDSYRVGCPDCRERVSDWSGTCASAAR
jgi:hypothetical protein